jgi:hypothetical protein
MEIQIPAISNLFTQSKNSVALRETELRLFFFFFFFAKKDHTIKETKFKLFSLRFTPYLFIYLTLLLIMTHFQIFQRGGLWQSSSKINEIEGEVE